MDNEKDERNVDEQENVSILLNESLDQDEIQDAKTEESEPSLKSRVLDIVKAYWILPFIAFGGMILG